MIIIVGLGNPGEKFKNTRHNAGFIAVDFFAEKNDFPGFALSKKYNALISEMDGVILTKPQTFMNDSGEAVKKITNDHKSQVKNIIIIHDDIDLPIGKIKIIKERGPAGHKGVESVIKNIGNDGLIRFRIGIQPVKGKLKNSENLVIKNFTKEEQSILNPIIEKTAEALDFFIKNGLEKTMNQFNG